MLNLFASEWTKLRTTASLWWTSGLLIFLPAVVTATMAAADTELAMAYVPLTVVMTVTLISLVIFTVQAAMTVTTEYRFGIPATTYRLTPARWTVGATKFVLYALIAAVLALATLVVSFTLGDAIAYNPADWTTNVATTRALWALPLTAAALVLMVQGLGWIVRNTAGAITLAFGLQFVVEGIIGIIPRVGDAVSPYLPFSNLYAFAFDVPTDHFTVWQSLGIFVAWAAVFWAIGIVLLEKRDV